MHMIDILVQPAIFMSLYYTLTLPEIKFLDYYIGRLVILIDQLIDFHFALACHALPCVLAIPCASSYLISITFTICLLCCSGMFTHTGNADYAKRYRFIQIASYLERTTLPTCCFAFVLLHFCFTAVTLFCSHVVLANAVLYCWHQMACWRTSLLLCHFLAYQMTDICFVA